MLFFNYGEKLMIGLEVVIGLSLLVFSIILLLIKVS